MKISHLFWLFLISASLTAVACKDNKDTTAETPATEVEVTPPGDAMTADPAATPGDAAATQATPGGSGSEPHYKCSKPGCTGSGAAQGKCPVCGSDLVHNQAFHAQSQLASPGTAPDNAIQVAPSGGNNAQPVQQGQAVAQNSKGEYHYTCPKGHPGAAAAGNCSKCGEALTHNQKFHQE